MATPDDDEAVPTQKETSTALEAEIKALDAIVAVIRRERRLPPDADIPIGGPTERP